MSDNLCSDENLEEKPSKKIKLSHEQTFKNDDEKDNERTDNLIVNVIQNNDNTNEEGNLLNLNSQNLNDNQAVESEESDSDQCVEKCSDTESEDYELISDGEFELKKYDINDESNIKINDNESSANESVSHECVDSSNYTNEKNTTELNSAGIDNDDVYDLLDKAYQEKNKNQNENGNENDNENKKIGVTKDDFKEYEKIVLEEVCKNHFDILPENWIESTHKSGMPIYLHKKSRVVTLSRPYFLGPGDPKSHLAPLSAISCLHYRKGLESKESLKNEPDFHVSKLGDMIIPNAKVETAQENIIKESLTHEELREYCQRRFK